MFVSSWVVILTIVILSGEMGLLAWLATGNWRYDRKYRALLAEADERIGQLSAVICDEANPNMKLLEDGSQWGMEMGPGQDGWHVTLDG